ncbi:CBS domain containing protein [Parasponia andersonii]|uniref:CBS domain containing protein n=1 Tax=Parasponia andersonii TaxID=3476 RepID=A0A2P5CAX8_PARAD|nr:CBS domain containing protein [Parasponia andersonii]
MRGDESPCCEPLFWVYLSISVSLVLFAGVTSGLAIGLLSFKQVDLEVLIKAGRPHAQRNAAKILPLVRNEHLVLCTLLVGKSLAMEALPIFMDTIFPVWVAILFSVFLVLAFAEIIPQAVCSRYGLIIGAKLSALVQLLVLLFFPIAYPISKLLDFILGKQHSVLLRRAEIKTLVALHSNEVSFLSHKFFLFWNLNEGFELKTLHARKRCGNLQAHAFLVHSEAGKGGELSHHETSIIAGALDLTQKTSKDVMTPISETFALDINSTLNLETMGLIASKGHSRIPIYSGDPKNIIGLILVKNLIFCHPEDETPVKYVTLRRMPRVYDNWPLYEILNQFLNGQSHMAVVVKCKDAENNAEGDSGVHDMNEKLDQKQSWKRGLVLPLVQEEHLSTSTETSPLYSSEMEIQSATLKNVMERDKNFRAQSREREGRGGNISLIDMEAQPSSFLDEEVIGIITLEDVMEALLQENILDETDAYMDVHNKIKIRPLNSKSSLSRPARVASFSHLQWRNSEPYPFSANPQALCSQSFGHIKTPLRRSASTLTCSRSGKSLPSSPTAPASPFPTLLTSHRRHRLSRVSYENLQLPSDVP